MESLLTVMLIRFAVIAAVVAVLVVVVYAIALRLKRRGRWEDVRKNVGPVVSRVAEGYVRRATRDGRRAWTANIAHQVADRFTGRRDR